MAQRGDPGSSTSEDIRGGGGDDKPHANLQHRDSQMSESYFEPRDAHDASLNNLAKNMFEKTAEYLQGELLLVQEDYKLLENLNKATAAKYSDMRQISANVGKSLHELNDKYRSLEPLLLQIDQIEDSVNKLEQAAYKLDSYSKRLEGKFKTLEKRQ
ncbi:biogenesis of lysosome-related organelles complex-1 subunit 2 [Folsomia candida]|uniref:biogenesis of lysosome-related organelles complex-1 subunit 2 n=1 Tax=Folsomia candida TaxID=158441 RepID=UPI000B900122|nr:biogenesis of lysosome-related organelles complex-1 subunit 2 [Folsomia candida]